MSKFEASFLTCLRMWVKIRVLGRQGSVLWQGLEIAHWLLTDILRFFFGLRMIHLCVKVKYILSFEQLVVLDVDADVDEQWLVVGVACATVSKMNDFNMCVKFPDPQLHAAKCYKSCHTTGLRSTRSKCFTFFVYFPFFLFYLRCCDQERARSVRVRACSQVGHS
jgi:hypothetical protein